jgi:hypothetical protein
MLDSMPLCEKENPVFLKRPMRLEMLFPPLVGVGVGVGSA